MMSVPGPFVYKSRGLSQEFDSIPCKSDALKANDNPNARKRPKRPIGRCRSFPIFPRQTIRKGRRCRKWEEWHSCGERVGDRVIASAAGRRGHFLEGRYSSGFDTVAPPGNAPSGGAKRARRPGLEI